MSSFAYLRGVCRILFLSCVCSLPAVSQSFEQALPAGYLNTYTGHATGIPFSSGSDMTVQLHYDSSNFAVAGPILINELYVRKGSGSLLPGAFQFSSVDILLAEASTDYASASTVFSDNILRGEQVRQGPYARDFDGPVAGAATHNWIPLRLQRSFLYDPTLGRDLVIQIRTCGASPPFVGSIDSVPGVNGSRRVFPGNCNASVASFSDGVMPVLKVDYTPVKSQTLPQGEMGGDSNSTTSFPVNTSNSQIWQWHYDSSEFLASGPITIAEVAVRADNNLAVNAFDFSSFKVTFIEALTDYQVGSHDPVFVNNILRSKVVHSGPWSSPATGAGAGGLAPWITLQLQDTFEYDPTQGNDFIIQIETCGAITPWGVALDGVSGPPGSVGGNRYGATTSCTATSHTFSNNEFVPVVKVAYAEREITVFPHDENFDRWGAHHQTKRTPLGWVQGTANSAGWRFHNRNTSVGTSSSDHTTGRKGIGFYMTTDDSLSSAQEFVESPIFDLTSLANPHATFWLFSHSVLAPQILDENDFDISILVHDPSGSVVATPASTGTISLLESGCWTKYGIDLSSFSGQRVSFLFRASTDSANGFYHDFAIDDFRLAERPPAESGQPATAMAALDINDAWNISGLHVGSPATGPFYSSAKPGGQFNAEIQGSAPFQPTALWVGPLNIAVATFGALGQMDTGTPDVTGDGIPEGIFVFGSGLNPMPSFLDLFFFTNAVGVTSVSLTLNPALPLRVIGTFQAAAADGLGGIHLSNAVTLEIVP